MRSAADRTRSQDLDNSQPRRLQASARRLSIAAALLLVAGGYVHFCLYRHGYRFIPKIGVSFLLQFLSSAILAGALLLQGPVLHVGRHALSSNQLARLSAIGLSVGTLAALAAAHTPAGLFQFHEMGLRPAPQSLIAIGAESLATVVLLIAMLQARHSALRPDIATTVPGEDRATIRDAA
jgi:hypothetical protein